MRDLFPGMASKSWTIKFALTLGRCHNDPQKFAEAHHYMNDFHKIDGRGANPRSRQHAIIKELKRARCDVVMPIVVGDALPAVRRYRQNGGSISVCFPVHAPSP